MKINCNFKTFKKKHLSNQNQILFKSNNCRDYRKVENLFNFFYSIIASFGY